MDPHKFEENPNPNAKIAFVTWTPLDYYTYKNVARHLPDSEFVLCDSWFKSIVKSVEMVDVANTILLLKKNREHWRVLCCVSPGIDPAMAENFFARYDLIGSLRFDSPISSPPLNVFMFKQKSVLMSYGAGKDLFTFGPWNAMFDVILSDGLYAERYLKHLSSVYVVGVPKYDDWFSGSVDQDGVKAMRSRLDLKKKTILYLPTHSISSSLEKFTDSVLGLADDYNLIVKLHHLNRYVNVNATEKINKCGDVIICDERDDILTLFAVADIVLSDTSSAALEAVLVDKPLVILDTKEDERTLTDDKEFVGLFSAPLQSYSKGIENKIKQPGFMVGVVVANPDFLRSGVKSAFLAHKKYENNRNRLRKMMFAYNDGKCGERSAEIIRKFCEDKIHPELPMLGAAIRSRFSSTIEWYQRQMLIWREEGKIRNSKKNLKHLSYGEKIKFLIKIIRKLI